MVRTQKKIWILIAIATVVRCFLAHFLEFGNDEVYYWTYAKHLQWNYFDHPPIVALLVRLTTFGMHLYPEIFIRAGAIICAAINTWLVFLIGTRIRDEKTGWYAALLYTSSFYCSIIAGTFILPDSPQVLFWMISIFLMTAIVDKRTSEPARNGLLLLTGVAIGLCVMSKVHGIFLWAGFGGYILFYDRKLLKRPALYGAALLTAIIISPILIWNIQNHFITYTFHNSRVGFFNKPLDWDSFLQQVIGSILYGNPVNFILYVIGIGGILKYKNVVAPVYRSLFLWLALPLIIVLLFLSLFNETLPHWSGPAYISILLLTAACFSYRNEESEKIPRGIFTSCALLLFVAVAGVPVIKWLPVQIGKKEERILGDGDVTLDMSGWRNFGNSFFSLYHADVKDGRMQKNSFILSDKWFPAANLDYYVATPARLNFIATGKLVDIHNYAWLNVLRPSIQPGDDAYFIYPTNYYGPPKPALLSSFEKIDSSALIPQYRSGIHVRDFVVIRLHHYNGGLSKSGVMEY